MSNNPIFKVVGRFVTRPNPDSNYPDMMIGVFVKNNSMKANYVYELREVFGELLLREVGESWMTCLYNHSEGASGWSGDIGSLMREHGNRLILSREELTQLKKEDDQ